MPSFFKIGPPAPEKKIFKGFYHILALIGQVVLEEMFEYYGDIRVYCPGWGHMSTWGPFCFRIINIQSYCAFPARHSL